MSAISGIDQALWDIKGKYFNAPVYELMGGKCRDRMKVYSWIGGDRPSDVGRAALEKKNEGFQAIKMNATEELQMIDTYDKVDAVLERVAAIREACGKYFGIAIDFHGRVHKPMAKVLAKKLEEFDPMFIEEPVLCEHMDEFKEIAACGSPIFLNNISGRVTSILMNISLMAIGSEVWGEDGGTTAVAVYAVLMYSSDLCWPLLYGISDSLSPAIGYNWGAESYDRVKKIVKCAYVGTATVGLVSTSISPAQHPHPADLPLQGTHRRAPRKSGHLSLADRTAHGRWPF